MYFVIEYLPHGKPDYGKPTKESIAKVVLQARDEESVVKVADEYIAGIKANNRKCEILQIRPCNSY